MKTIKARPRLYKILDCIGDRVEMRKPLGDNGQDYIVESIGWLVTIWRWEIYFEKEKSGTIYTFI
jgi:hypothetical protein